MNETVVDYNTVNEIVKAIQQSQTQLTLYDMVIIIGVVVVAVSVLLYVLWRMGIIRKTENGNGDTDILDSLNRVTEELHRTTVNTKLATDAHSIILTKDQDGVPIILAIPKYLRDIMKITDRVSKTLDKLESHLHEK